MEEAPGEGPLISVVIATYLRPERLRETLAHFGTLDFPENQYEIIVADDGSDPPLDPASLRAPAGVALHCVRVSHGGVGAARNAGAARATGECIVFVADDCLPEPAWLRTIAQAYAAFPECALGGEIVHGLPANPYSTAADVLIRYLRQQLNPDPLRATFFTPNNLAVPAAKFRALGGFDPRFNPAGEDRDFCCRWVEAGYRMRTCPEIRVLHVHPLSLRSFLYMQFIHGCGSMQYRRMRAHRNGLRVRMEPASFYMGLLRLALAQPPAVGALLFLSQIAVAAGAARNLLAQR